MFEASSWMFDFIKILLESLMNQRFEDYIKDYNSNFSKISKYAVSA